MASESVEVVVLEKKYLGRDATERLIGKVKEDIADNESKITAENERAVAAEAQALTDAKAYTDEAIASASIVWESF